MRIAALAAALGLAIGGACAAQEAEGIAAKYPGDAGIEKDERVLLYENFETATFWLMNYVTENSAKTNKVNRVWFDDVVVATEYIGPIRPSASSS
jgi:hypothetical protein